MRKSLILPLFVLLPLLVCAVPYPAGWYLDVTAAPYLAAGDGVTDDRAAIQAALNDALNATDSRLNLIKPVVYLPAGTYRLSGGLSLGSNESKIRGMRIEGAGPGSTVLRLDSAAAGFGNPGTPAVVLNFFDSASGNNVAFNNNLRDLTIDTGSGNPGAVGVKFTTNNGGGVRNVVIRSSDPDGTGVAGLQVTTPNSGIGYIKDLSIEGFDTGILAADKHATYTLDGLSLSGQGTAGILVDDKPLNIIRLHSINTVPALRSTGELGMQVMVDAVLESGDPADVAIHNQAGWLYLRNVANSGYGNTINDGGSLVAGDFAGREYRSGGSYSLDPTPPDGALRLAFPEIPEVPWHDPLTVIVIDELADIPAPGSITDPNTWVIVDGNANGNDTDEALVQGAMDSGARTVALAPGQIDFQSTVTIGANVERVIGGPTYIIPRSPYPSNFRHDRSESIFNIGTSNHGAVVIERLQSEWTGRASPQQVALVESASDADLIIDNLDLWFAKYRTAAGGASGRVFLVNYSGQPPMENLSKGVVNNGPDVHVIGQECWIYAGNSEFLQRLETETTPFVINDGGRLGILGYKLGENFGPYLGAVNGGVTEALGVLVNVTDQSGVPIGVAGHELSNSSTTLVSFERRQYVFDPVDPTRIRYHDPLLKETRDGVLYNLAHADIPERGSNPAEGESLGAMLPFYASKAFGTTDYGWWLNRYFTHAEIQAGTLTLDILDPDGDGADGRIEFILDRNPLIADAGAPVTASYSWNGTQLTAQLSFTLRRQTTPYTVALERSADLGPASWSSVLLTGSGILDLTPALETDRYLIEDTAPAGTRSFYRLSATE